MSEKKNRHEVTDLIKGEKNTYGRETSLSDTGNPAGGGGAAVQRLGTPEPSSVT